MSTLRTDELGQLLIIGLEEDRWSAALEKRLRTIRPGGILLAQRNLRTPGSAAELLAKIARVLDAPPFLVLEEEGGAVSPLRNCFPPLPSPNAVAAQGPAAVKKLGELSGAGLNLIGFNTTFAPLLDLTSNSADALSRPENFGRNGEQVANCGGAFVQGLQVNDILPCPKYFPGICDAEPDPESGCLISGKPMARIWSEDLVPYRKLLPRLQLVMVSHLAYKAYDLDSAVPASLSANVLEGLLRVKLGFHGVCLADFYGAASEMLRTLNPSAPKSISIALETLPKSIAAGVDILVVREGAKISDLIRETLKKSEDARTLPTQRICEAVKRIARAKKGIRLPTGKFSKKAFDRLCREFEGFNKECRSAE